MQPARDFEMQHEPQVAVEPEGDLLAESPDLVDHLPVRGAQGRVGGAQQER